MNFLTYMKIKIERYLNKYLYLSKQKSDLPQLSLPLRYALLAIKAYKFKHQVQGFRGQGWWGGGGSQIGKYRRPADMTPDRND